MSCSKEWDDLFEQSRQQQMEQKDQRAQRVDQDEDRLLKAHREDTEDFHKLTVHASSRLSAALARNVLKHQI